MVIPATAHTCGPIGSFNDVLKDSPGSREGGCTRDLVHRFYEEQYQLNGGAQNRYATGSDAAGLTMGYYDTKLLPIYGYLHEQGHPHYAILDNIPSSTPTGCPGRRPSTRRPRVDSSTDRSRSPVRCPPTFPSTSPAATTP
ncbi:MAG: hypothetical protein E6G14_12630 [Actinobacteria bacterium]|nr:MAG: hypothetical protein E6G14_12630 [Actinomycetota bacterium]